MSTRRREKFVIFYLVISLFMFILLESSINRVWGAEEKYPSRPIEMFCGYAAGGKMDLNTRLLAKGFEKNLKVPVITGTKPGAGEVIAATALANAVPDGYTLATLGDASLITSILLGRATYKRADLRVIGEFNLDSPVVVANAESPWKTIEDFIDYARKNPGLSYSHIGVGSSLHLRMEYFCKLANIKMSHVPFKGDPEVIAAVLGKHVSLGVCSANGAMPQVNAGKMRILFCFSYPGQGFDPTLPNITSFFGKDAFNLGPVPNYLAAPGKTPEGIVKILEQTLEKVTKDSDFIEGHKKMYLDVRFTDGETVINKILPKKTLEFKKILQEVGLIK